MSICGSVGNLPGKPSGLCCCVSLSIFAFSSLSPPAPPVCHVLMSLRCGRSSRLFTASRHCLRRAMRAAFVVRRSENGARQVAKIYLRLSSWQKFSVNVFAIVNTATFVLWCQQQQLQQQQQLHIDTPLHRPHIHVASAAIAIAFVKFCVRRRICQIVCFVWRVQLLSNFFLSHFSFSLSNFSSFLFSFLCVRYTHNDTPPSRCVAQLPTVWRVYQYLTCCIARQLQCTYGKYPVP